MAWTARDGYTPCTRCAYLTQDTSHVERKGVKQEEEKDTRGRTKEEKEKYGKNNVDTIL